MNLDGQYANERFTEEFDEEAPDNEFPLEDESAAPEEQASTPRVTKPAPYSERSQKKDFEEDGEGYDRFYRVAY